MKNFLKTFTSKPRVAGQKSDVLAQEAIISELKKLKKDFYLQKFPFTSWENLSCEVFFDEQKVPSVPVMWSGSGKAQGKIDKVGIEKTFEGAYEFEKFSVENTGNEKVFLLSREDRIWMQPLDYPDANQAFVMIFPNKLKKIKEGQVKKASVFLENKFWDSQSANIICPAKKEAKFLLAAHYDSVPASPGANDNAAGVVTLLEVMKKFPDDNFEYVFFGAEEWNLSGSKFWARNNQNKFSLALNFDMIAGRESQMSLFAEDEIYEKISKNFSNLEVCKGIHPCWDAYPIAKAGIPVVHFIAYPYLECHYPNDTLDKLDLGKIDEVLGMVNSLTTQKNYGFQFPQKQ